uniref:Uncharacterized protein n=1 Tax=Rhabditophanes sp. KR3021 TaxID=114890 RepID=A0AC35TJV3_9BILA
MSTQPKMKASILAQHMTGPVKKSETMFTEILGKERDGMVCTLQEESDKINYYGSSNNQNGKAPRSKQHFESSKLKGKSVNCQWINLCGRKGIKIVLHEYNIVGREADIEFLFISDEFKRPTVFLRTLQMEQFHYPVTD